MKQITLTLPDELFEAIESRVNESQDNRSKTIVHDLGTYYKLLSMTKIGISNKEIEALKPHLRKIYTHADQLPLLIGGLSTVLKNNVSADLVRRIEALSPLELVCLIDLVQR